MSVENNSLIAVITVSIYLASFGVRRAKAAFSSG